MSRGYKIGQFWYLVSSEWWQNWQQYTQSVSTIPCSSCKTAANYVTNRVNSISHGCAGNNGANNGLNSLDEAVVCDESFTSNSPETMGDLLYAADSSSLGSGSSGISCSGRNSALPPGPIDNSNLIETPPYKNVRTLTGA